MTTNALLSTPAWRSLPAEDNAPGSSPLRKWREGVNAYRFLVSVQPPGGERGDGIASDPGAEHVGEVGEERASLQPAGERGREETLDGALSLLGLAAEGELAVDDRAAQTAFGVVVGRFDAVDDGEGPQRGPALEQVGGEETVVLRLRALARGLFEQRSQLVRERLDPLEELAAITLVPVGVPGREQALCDRQAGLAELLLGGESFAVGGEVPQQVRPAELAPLGVEVVVGPPAVGAGDALEVLAEEGLGLAPMAVGGDPEDSRLGRETPCVNPRWRGGVGGFGGGRGRRARGPATCAR